MKKIIPIRAGVAIPAQSTPMLNDEQQAAIQDVMGYHAINSGAGTGKSTVLVARLSRIHPAVSDGNSTYAGVHEISGVGTFGASREYNGCDDKHVAQLVISYY